MPMGPGVGNPFIFSNPGNRKVPNQQGDTTAVASSSDLGPRTSSPVGEIINGVIVGSIVESSCSTSSQGQSSSASMDDDFQEPVTVVSASSKKSEWHFNTSVAIAINALTNLKEAGGSKMLQIYLSNTFSLIGNEVVRKDFRDFLEIVAKQKNNASAEQLWQSIFGKVTNPGSVTLAKNAQSLTTLNDYNLAQFSVRPLDMKYAFTQEKMNTAVIKAMCEMMGSMQEKLDNLEAAMTAPTDDSVCVESAVHSALAPLVAQVENHTVSQTAVCKERKTTENRSSPEPQRETLASLMRAPAAQSSVEAPWKTVAPKSQSRARAQTVTGSAGSYVGPKIDKGLKIMVGDEFAQEQVVAAVTKAATVQTSQVQVEELATSMKNYALSYRVKITAMRKDHAKSLLTSELWPAGMQVTEWNRPWRPLRKHQEIKVFVGNVRRSTTHQAVADKLKGIYEAANIQITTALAEPFVGKKDQKDANHQNMVITLTAEKEGISMDPIQVAKANGKIPAGIFVRRYNQRQPLTPPEW